MSDKKGGWVGTTDGVPDPDVLHDPEVKRVVKKAARKAANPNEQAVKHTDEQVETVEPVQDEGPDKNMSPCCEADAAKHGLTLAEAKLETPEPCTYCQQLTDRYAVNTPAEAEK